MTSIETASTKAIKTGLRTMRARLDSLVGQPDAVLFPPTTGRKEGGPNSGLFIIFGMMKNFEAELTLRGIDVNAKNLGTNWTALVQEMP